MEVPKAPETPEAPAFIASRVQSLLPSIYSSSLISQSTDPTDQSVLVFPDWKVVHEVENSSPGAKELWDGSLDWTAGRGGKLTEHPDSVGRRRSWTLPYRAVVLLCELLSFRYREAADLSRLTQATRQAMSHRSPTASCRLSYCSREVRHLDRRNRRLTCLSRWGCSRGA
jgi:hypothetical protein